MDLISIGINDDADVIHERLKAELNVLSKQGIEVNLKQRNQGNLRFFDCSIESASAGKFSFNDIIYISKHYIANAISDIIIDIMETKILKKCIDTNYYYFGDDERARILDFACKSLGSDINDRDENCVYRLSRKARVLQKVLDYLDMNSNLIVDGFIRFRMKDYVVELEEAVDRSVEEYLMEREYNEFIKLLRYFVEIQEPKVDTVNVLKNPDNSYKLLDGEGRVVSNELLDDLAGEVLENNINYEDLLVSSLITIAPTRIIFHAHTVSESSEILDTIKKVFYQKVIICHGCEMCYVKKPIEKE
jgi:putative sporulation protein YtxC